jgi:hypothetical protein
LRTCRTSAFKPRAPVVTANASLARHGQLLVGLAAGSALKARLDFAAAFEGGRCEWGCSFVHGWTSLFREVPGIVATARALATESGIPLLARFATFRTVPGPLLLAPFTRREVAGALTRQNLGHRAVASGVVRFELRNRVVMSWHASNFVEATMPGASNDETDEDVMCDRCAVMVSVSDFGRFVRTFAAVERPV